MAFEYSLDGGPWSPVDPGVGISDFGGTTFGQGFGGGGSFGNLLTALQGLKAPAAPEAQRVATPSGGPSAPMTSAPAPRAVTPTRGDQFMQLVQLLGNGGAAAAPQTPVLQPRLSQALGYR